MRVAVFFSQELMRKTLRCPRRWGLEESGRKAPAVFELAPLNDGAGEFRWRRPHDERPPDADAEGAPL
jgi:hypothetical protein